TVAPCGQHRRPCWWQGWPLSAAPCGGWPWPVTPAGGLVVADYPCKGCGCGRPPLQRAWPWPAAPFLTAFAVKTWQEHVE
ncbi:hypothetical protein B296_00042790, partial [Ensete ventricosum]